MYNKSREHVNPPKQAELPASNSLTIARLRATGKMKQAPLYGRVPIGSFRGPPATAPTHTVSEFGRQQALLSTLADLRSGRCFRSDKSICEHDSRHLCFATVMRAHK